MLGLGSAAVSADRQEPSDGPHVRFELGDDHVGVITLDRPEARNALTWGMYADLERFVRDAPAAGARCLIVTGADPAFCSGDDVRQVMGGGAAGKAPLADSGAGARTPRLTPAADALLHTDLPVIAAVNGAAVGWGMELSLMADIRIASDRARFGELFVLRGLVSDVAGLGPTVEAMAAVPMLMMTDVRTPEIHTGKANGISTCQKRCQADMPMPLAD